MFSKRLLTALFLLFNTSAFAADSTVTALTAASALGGTELFYCVQGGADRKCTGAQLGTYILTNPTITGSFTATGLVGNAALANPATTVNGQTCTLGSTCTVTAAATAVTVGSTTIGSGTTTRILYDNAGTLGEYTLTGTGTVVAMQTSPVFVTDLTTPIAKLSATSNQLVFQSAGVTGTLSWAPATSNKTITLPNGTTDFTGTSGIVQQASSGAAFTVSSVALASLATQATNTIVGNATSGTAVPTALAIGTCSTASSALIWTTNTGFGCNTSITANAVAVGGITGLGTGVATALAIAVGSAGGPVTFNGAGGTPSSIVLTNATGTAASLVAGVAGAVAVGGITGLGTGVGTALATAVGSAGGPVTNGGALGTPSSGVATNLTGTASGLTAGNVTGLTTNGTAAVGQLPGTTTNDAAAAGKVGEILTASATAVSVTTGAAKTITSKALTAGDWDVQCTTIFIPDTTTAVVILFAEVSPTTDAIPQTLGNYWRTDVAGITLSGTKVGFATPSVPVSLSGTTTYYCTVFATFSVSTMTVDSILVARRRR